MNVKNDMVQKQLTHRTIREFTDEKIPEAVFDLIIETAKRTATSSGMQASSIIRITDNKIKKEISEICNQKYVARIPELLIFIVDQYRNSQITKEMNYNEESFTGMDSFFSSFTDACITAQNIVNTAEGLGLGTVYLGSILNDSEKICKLLQLPELTFPVVGLGIGYPNEKPQLKPRMDMKYRVFENRYMTFESYLEEVRDYDESMSSYYDLRNSNRRVDSFTNQVVSKLKKPNLKRQEILNIVNKMGFSLILKDGK